VEVLAVEFFFSVVFSFDDEPDHHYAFSFTPDQEYLMKE